MWYIIITVREGNLTDRKNALNQVPKKFQKNLKKVLDKPART